MKTLYASLFLLLSFPLLLSAQSSAFVLVDVSGSGPQQNTVREEAKNIARDLCLGKYQSAIYDSKWKWYGKPDPKIKDIIEGKGQAMVDPNRDGFLMIMPFGKKDRYRKFQIEKVNSATDISNFFDAHYPRVYTDPLTYKEIALAKAASIAKGNQVSIDQYYLIEVSDQLSDTGSKVPLYDQIEKEILADYGSSNAFEVKLATLRYEGSNKNYQIIIKQVNVKNINVGPSVPGSRNVSKKSLSLIRPEGGTLKKPIEYKGPIIWRCLGCDSTLSYKVTAVYRGKKKGVKKISRTVSGTSVNLNYPEPGIYQISVSAEELRSRSAFIKVNARNNNSSSTSGSEGGCSGFPVVLFFLLVAGGAYYMLKEPKPTNRSNSNNPKKPQRRQSRNDESDQDDGGRF